MQPMTKETSVTVFTLACISILIRWYSNTMWLSHYVIWPRNPNLNLLEMRAGWLQREVRSIEIQRTRPNQPKTILVAPGISSWSSNNYRNSQDLRFSGILNTTFGWWRYGSVEPEPCQALPFCPTLYQYARLLLCSCGIGRAAVKGPSPMPQHETTWARSQATTGDNLARLQVRAPSHTVQLAYSSDPWWKNSWIAVLKMLADRSVEGL